MAWPSSLRLDFGVRLSEGVSMATTVSIDNFVAAETARMFDGTLMTTGGVNRWTHYREPVAMDAQTVIRMNGRTRFLTDQNHE